MTPKSHIDEMNEQLDQLKTARELLDLAKAAKKRLVEEFQKTEEFATAISAEAFAQDEVDRLDAKIRADALSLHEICADLPDRVTVKKFTNVSIKSIPDAIAWCKQNFTPALKLDEKMFEKAAKDGTIPAELAEVKTEFRAQIATKL